MRHQLREKTIELNGNTKRRLQKADPCHPAGRRALTQGAGGGTWMPRLSIMQLLANVQ